MKTYQVVAPYCYLNWIDKKAFWVGLLHGTKDPEQYKRIKDKLDNWKE